MKKREAGASNTGAVPLSHTGQGDRALPRDADIRGRTPGSYSAASLRSSRGSGNTMSSVVVDTVSTVTS